MVNVSRVLAQATATTDGGVDLGFYLILAAVLAVAAVVMKLIFSRRAASSTDAVVRDQDPAQVIRIPPAPPFPSDVARLRAFVGDTTPPPRITRYTVPIVTVDNTHLSIRDKKIGDIVSVPLTDIESAQMRVTTIRPKGTLLAQNYPSLWVTVRRGAATQSLALTPITGAYAKVSEAEAEAMAAALNSLLAAAS
ncbi:hypothetical protein ACFQRL_14335 [Microbacterium fluvii]|uniref:Uncharacterized protein n=1 Tax=Microbacterium fluvii TaxID=415215 RepID=A0ABW2HJH1_9MICO|nr:hypothetical protein [Microbacterium fluvii]MCU4673769.1 hypothetical protein [Microbacterium fluvii]